LKQKKEEEEQKKEEEIEKKDHMFQLHAREIAT
jgi:hypothetical protein